MAVEIKPQISALERYASALREQKQLASEIREYVKNQKNLWNKIPNLFLEAEGRSGYLDSNPYYNFIKTWTLDGLTVVDLSTGEIIYDPTSFPSNERRKPMTDYGVAQLAGNLEVLDASKIVNRLQREAKKEYFGGYNPRKTAQWRLELRYEDPFLLETLDPALTLEGQAKTLKKSISDIEGHSKKHGSELTLEQVKNAIGHVLRASDFDDRGDGSGAYSPVDINIRAAHEIMQSVSFYIDLKSPQFAKPFANLSDVIWHTAVDTTAKVRAERGMEHFEEGEKIYKTLGEEYTKRAGGNAYMFAESRKKPLKPNAIIGNGKTTASEIADWFLITPFDK